MKRLALLSMHGCPVARLGERDTGGMNVYVRQVAKELGRLGNQVDVYTRRHDPNDPETIELGPNARVIHLEAGPYSEAKESLFRYVATFLGELYSFQRSEGLVYDLVHSHYWLSGCAGVELAQEWDVPHVVTFHTLAKTKLRARVGERESEHRLAAESRVAREADAIVVSTHSEKEDLFRLYGVQDSRMQVIPPGVDIDLFYPVDKARARESLGLSGKRVVLSVGRIEPLKGLDIVIGAMALLEDPRDARLVIVGGSPGRDREFERLKSVAAGLGIEGMVTFTGAVDQRELPRYYSAADVLVLPSYYESFGLVALEAMACGTPVIASRVGGPKAFVKAGETGYLVPWHCPEPYAQRLDILLSNPALRDSMSRAATAKAHTMGWGLVARRSMSLYSSLVMTYSSAVGA